MLAENWPAVELFLAAQTQWRYAGMSGIPTGLDYTALPVTAAMAAIPMSPELFADLCVMEDEALTVFREKRARS